MSMFMMNTVRMCVQKRHCVFENGDQHKNTSPTQPCYTLKKKIKNSQTDFAYTSGNF